MFSLDAIFDGWRVSYPAKPVQVLSHVTDFADPNLTLRGVAGGKLSIFQYFQMNGVSHGLSSRSPQLQANAITEYIVLLYIISHPVWG